MSFRSLAFEFRMGESTVRSIVYEACEVLWTVLQPKRMPAPDGNLCKRVAHDYYIKWNFPNCFGSIDGKHIRIDCPDKTGSEYYNYKHFFPLVLQGVADAHCKFLTIDVGASMGKQSDGGVFRNSDLFTCLESNAFNVLTMTEIPGTNIKTPFVILGD